MKAGIEGINSKIRLLITIDECRLHPMADRWSDAAIRLITDG
jgi:hypothetical protein